MSSINKTCVFTGATLLICMLVTCTIFAESSQVSSNSLTLNSNGTLQIFSKDRSFLGALNLGYVPSAYAVNDQQNSVYVTDREGRNILIYSLNSSREIGHIANSGKIVSAALDSISHRLFLLDRSSSTIHVIDSLTNEKVGEISTLQRPSFMHYNSDRGILFVASAGNLVSALSARDGAELGRITDLESAPLNIVSDSASDRLAIQHRKTIAVYHLSTLKLFDWLRLEGHPRKMQIDDSQLYVQLSGKDEEKNIAVFDLRTLELADWIYTGARTYSGKTIQTSTFMADHGTVYFHDSATSRFFDLNETATAETQSGIAQLPSGVTIADEFGVNNHFKDGAQNTPAAAFDGSGNFFFTWLDGANLDGSGDGIFARTFDVTNPSTWSSATDDFKVTNANGVPGAGDQLNPGVSADSDGNFVVVWVDASGVDNDVRYALYNADKTLKATAIATKKTAGHQREPAVAMCPNGNFIVAWSSTGDGDGRGTFFRRFDNNGNALDGNDIQANTYIPGNTYAIKVAANSNCDFVIAWRDDDNLPRTHVRTFHSNGGAVDLSNDKVVPPMNTTHKNFNPGLAMADDGSFVVAFTENSAGGTIGALFNFDQTLKNVAILHTPGGKNPFVATSMNHSQNATGVGMSSDGKFVIAWRDDQMGALKQIGARFFDADGTPHGGNFNASVDAIKGDQFAPGAAMDAAGNFIVTWYERQNSPGIFATYFSVGPPPSPMTITGTNPTSLDRGNSQSVDILGSGFTGGLGAADFYISGTNTLAFSATAVNCADTNTCSGNVAVPNNASYGKYDVKLTSGGKTKTGKGVFAVKPAGTYPAPSVTSVDPNSGNQGDTILSLAVNGTNFANDTGLSVDFGNDIIVGTPVFVNSTKILVDITISPFAAIGARDVTVTNPGGQSGTCSSCLNVIALVPLFSDDFSGAIAWNTKWTSGNQGAWSVSGGSLVGTAGAKATVDIRNASGAFLGGADGCQLCTIYASIEPGSTGSVTLLGWYKGSGDYCELTAKPGSTSWTFKRHRSGSVTTSKSQTSSFIPGHAYAVSMTVTHNAVTVTVDGVTMFGGTIGLANTPPKGKVGFRVANGATATFDDLVVIP